MQHNIKSIEGENERVTYELKADDDDDDERQQQQQDEKARQQRTEAKSVDVFI